MPGPTFTFAFILATLIGAVFHIIVGGDVRRLALLLLAGWIGFGIGHLIGLAFQVNLLNIGSLRAFTAFLGALVALFVAMMLSPGRFRKRTPR